MKIFIFLIYLNVFVMENLMIFRYNLAYHFLERTKTDSTCFLLCLGEYTFKSLGFKDYHILKGEVFAYKNFFIMPSYDLDFIEKNPSYEKNFIQDLKKLKDFYEKIFLIFFLSCFLLNAKEQKLVDVKPVENFYPKLSVQECNTNCLLIF